MRKRVLIVDSGGAACPLFRAALTGVEEMEVYGADNGRQAAELVAELGGGAVVLLDIELPFLDLVEFLSLYPPPGQAREDAITVVCSDRNAVLLERGLAAGVRAVA
jgi:CheY-like chemotaxis protein